MKDLPNSVVYRGRRYFRNGIKTWYEPCSVVKHTAKFIVVQSEAFPGSPLYPGGEFYLNRSALTKDGFAYHSRHGEYFYLEQPELGDLFPSMSVLGMKSAAKYDAEARGWNVENISTLSKEQLRAFIMAEAYGYSLDEALMREF